MMHGQKNIKELPLFAPAVACYCSCGYTSLVSKACGYRMYCTTGVLIPENRRVLTPPLATVFQTGSWTYRASYIGIRPSEREAYHSELVPKLRRRGVLPLLVMLRVYKVFITTLTYKM